MLTHTYTHTHTSYNLNIFLFLFAIKEIKFSFKPADTDHILEESSGNQQLMSYFLNSKRNQSRPGPVCKDIAAGWVLWGQRRTWGFLWNPAPGAKNNPELTVKC